MGLSRDGQRLLATAIPREGTGAEDHPVVLFDVAEGTRRTITSHANRVSRLGLRATASPGPKPQSEVALYLPLY